MTLDPGTSSSGLKRKEPETDSVCDTHEKVAKLSPDIIDPVFSSFLDSWHLEPKRAHFIWFMSRKLYGEYCHAESDVDRLVRLLFDASSDLKEDSTWEGHHDSARFRSVYNATTSGRRFLGTSSSSSSSSLCLASSSTSSSDCSTTPVDLDAMEMIRPKSKLVNLNHARIQPLNWAVRRGHVDLLRFLIDESTLDSDLFSERMSDGNKLFVGAITFAVMSGNVEMVDYACRDLGLDPNRGPKDWEPVLVVFGMELRNWQMLLALIRGGASLYHTNGNNLCVMRHMFIEGWGWDSETRLDTLLGLLFLGTPFFEDNQLVYPAETLSRDYAQLFPRHENARSFVCWNDSYDYVLRYIGMARAYCKATCQTSPPAADAPVQYSPPPSFLANVNSSLGNLLNGNGDAVRRASLPALLPCGRSLHSRESRVSLSEDDESAGDGDDEDDDFSDLVEDSLYAHEETFLRQMRRRWMNSVAVLMRRCGLYDDHIDLMFSFILPYYGRPDRHS